MKSEVQGEEHGSIKRPYFDRFVVLGPYLALVGRINFETSYRSSQNGVYGRASSLAYPYSVISGCCPTSRECYHSQSGYNADVYSSVSVFEMPK